MRMVFALGGNALLKRGEILSAENQRRNMRAAAASLAQACDGHQVAIVHGNGPQVGLLALEADAYSAVPPYPLDVLGAESQGMIGYVIAQELRNIRPDRAIIALLTQTLVDPSDPAFQHPTKPIGPVYDKDDIAALAKNNGWVFAADGKGMRRVVASPMPVGIIELPLIEQLVTSNAITICCGGGGIPVRQVSGVIEGVEAVIDKDLAAALLAQQLGAERLVILTDVDGVYLDWGTAKQRLIRETHVGDLCSENFSEGSMEPKVRAVYQFVKATGKAAVIGSLEQVESVLAGQSGTLILPPYD
jgi:carbamate kinase